MYSKGESRRLIDPENARVDYSPSKSESSLPPSPPTSSPYFIQGPISLDFERVVNEYSILACKENVSHSGRAATRWALTIFSGILTGLTTVLIVSITEKLVDWRTVRLDQMIIDPNTDDNLIFLQFSFVSLLLSICSCLLCVAWVPEAVGSGIPEVKAYLNGCRIKRFSSWKLFVAKIVGTILSVASSLAVGKEGPLVHIGAIVGASCSKISVILSHLLAIPYSSGQIYPSSERRDSILSKLWLWTTSDLSYFANDSEKRDFVTIGAACGFAASFGTPIGGLLFILDDISSFFDKSISLRVLVASAIATLCLAVYRRDLSEYGAISLRLGEAGGSGSNIFVSRFEEIPFFVLVGLIGGIMGGTFSRVLEFRTRIQQKVSSRALKICVVAIISIVTSCVLFYATSMTWTCKDIDETNYLLEAVKESRRFFCQEGQVDEFAMILLGSRDRAIKWILTDPSQFEPYTLFMVGILFYFLTILTFGSSLPLGVFTPTVLIGASLGGATGLILQSHVDSEITPSTFAMLGVAALLAGVQRSTVSVCVILVEATGHIKVLIPVIIAVVVARYVASFVHPEGIYKLSITLQGYPYLEPKESRMYDMIQVGDVMSQPVVTLRPRETARHLVELLEKSYLHGFPVVDENGRFLGLVRRNQIVALLECGVFEENDGTHHHKQTPKARDHKSPLMHWAYHIKDDRYNYLEAETSDEELEDDDFDSNQYLLSIQDIVRSARGTESSKNRIFFAGDDSLPPLNSTPMQRFRKFRSEASTDNLAMQESSANLVPTGFAKVGTGGTTGQNVIISWLNPKYKDRLVNLSAVMNRGALSVPDYFPLSKAYYMFTKLGKRWIVVTGGSQGGDVVGILTRETLLPSHIQDKNGANKKESVGKSF